MNVIEELTKMTEGVDPQCSHIEAALKAVAEGERKEKTYSWFRNQGEARKITIPRDAEGNPVYAWFRPPPPRFDTFRRVQEIGRRMAEQMDPRGPGGLLQ